MNKLAYPAFQHTYMGNCKHLLEAYTMRLNGQFHACTVL